MGKHTRAEIPTLIVELDTGDLAVVQSALICWYMLLPTYVGIHSDMPEPPDEIVDRINQIGAKLEKVMDEGAHMVHSMDPENMPLTRLALDAGVAAVGDLAKRAANAISRGKVITSRRSSEMTEKIDALIREDEKKENSSPMSSFRI